MNVVQPQDESYTEQLLREANTKMLGAYRKRKIHESEEVRMEARVESLEKSMHKVDSEIQMMNKTMRDIADTLKEIKDDQKKIQTFEIQKAMLERDIADQKKLIDLVFNKLDVVKNDIQAIKELNAGNNVKVGNHERTFWLIVTGAIGALGWFTR